LHAVLEQVRVEGRSSLSELPSTARRTEIPFENGIWLLGYELGDSQARPAENLRLTLYWRTDRQVADSYTVFTHLLDRQSRLWGQKDSLPASGTLPTTAWVPGEVIVDEYDILVSPDTPPGYYSVETGMYLATTGQRLAVLDTAGAVIADHVVLDSMIQVAP
jgi:hypothetical protein